MQTIKNKYNKLRDDEEERYKKEILDIQTPYNFFGNINDLKKPFNEDDKYFLKIVRIRNKFIDGMYEKYLELKNIGDNQRPLQQIFNKREFNYLNKYNNEIDRVNEMLNLYKTLKADSDNARWKHNDIIKKLNDQEEFEIYKLKKDAKIQKQKQTIKQKKEKNKNQQIYTEICI